MIRSKILDMQDLQRDDFNKVLSKFHSIYGQTCFEVPCRKWEYVAAIVFSGIENNPGICLEAGCGHSCFAQFLSVIGNDVHAFDIGHSEHHHLGRPRYYDMSMVNINFPDNHFDYIFAMSSIEHVNAGKFKIEGMPFDTGDTHAMLEFRRVLKPTGLLIITTDFAKEYYPPPGLWPSGSHRIYDFYSLFDRLVIAAGFTFHGKVNFDLKQFDSLVHLEPKGYKYTEAIITLKIGG